MPLAQVSLWVALASPRPRVSPNFSPKPFQFIAVAEPPGVPPVQVTVRLAPMAAKRVVPVPVEFSALVLSTVSSVTYSRNRPRPSSSSSIYGQNEFEDEDDDEDEQVSVTVFAATST
jgi:hypothetical protein